MARRGLSPIIATVLLILIAVSASVIIWTWVSGSVSSNPVSQQPALQERITIDGVSVNDTDVTIYVTNIGQVPVTIMSAYVLNATTGQAVCNTTSLSISIDPQTTGKVNVEIASSCSESSLPHGTYIAKVVTRNAVSATYTFNN